MTGRGSDSFAWDTLGCLERATVAGKSACYRFAPDGSLKTRVYDSTGGSACSAVTAATGYLLGGGYETDADGAVTTSYTNGPAGDLASYAGPPTSSSTVTYLYYTGHGDLAAEANSSGTTISGGEHAYDPWGAPTAGSQPANATSHRYTGRWDEQYDATTSLVLMGARPYDPALGRFLAVDPIDGGSLNSYDYAGQDPINGYDLDGLQALAGGDRLPDESARSRGIWRAQSRASRALGQLRNFLRYPEQLRDQNVDAVGRMIDRFASATDWTRKVVRTYEDGAQAIKWTNPNEQSGEAILLERSGSAKHGVPRGTWYLRMSVGSNRSLPTDPAVVRIPLSR